MKSSFFEAIYSFYLVVVRKFTLQVYDGVHSTACMNWRRQGQTGPAGAPPACSLLHGGINSLKNLS